MKNFVLLLIFPLLFACHNKQSKQGDMKMDNLSSDCTDVTEQLHSKEAIIDSFLRSFNEIQDNLNTIKSKQKSVALNTQNSEFKKTKQEQILSDLQFINNLLDRNRQAYSALNEKLKVSGLKLGELEKTIFNLNTQLADQEYEINLLRGMLSFLNIKLNSTEAAYESERKKSKAKTDMLNTAYCAIGTFSDLTKQGLITHKDGKLKELNPDLYQSMLSPIDIYKTKQITIAAKKVEVLTRHAKSSYKLDNKTNIKTLDILDPDEFWKTSKYLIIEVSTDEPAPHDGLLQ